MSYETETELLLGFLDSAAAQEGLRRARDSILPATHHSSRHSLEPHPADDRDARVGATFINGNLAGRPSEEETQPGAA